MTEHYLAADQVYVNSHHGVITLVGSVSSASKREAVEAVAASVRSVRGVVNRLTVG